MVSVHIKQSEVPDQIVRRSKLETECMPIRLKVEFNFLGIIQIRQTIVQKAASSLIFFFSFSVQFNSDNIFSCIWGFHTLIKIVHRTVHRVIATKLHSFPFLSLQLIIASFEISAFKIMII